MSQNDRETPAPSDQRLEAVLWEVRKAVRVARCELWRHPLGYELRCDVDGETHQTAVQRRRDTAEDLAHDWQQASIGKGWNA